MRRKLTIILLCCLAIIFIASGITLSKYASTLGTKGGSLATGHFYFRSNVLTSDETPPTVTANGPYTTFIIANGADSNSYSDMQINYTVTYSVKIDGSDSWTEVGSDSYTLMGEQYSTKTITVECIEYNGTVYNDVLVTASTSQKPYIATLGAVFSFNYTTEPTLVYEYEPEMGVITLVINTNLGSGDYVIEWAPGILPDNADPNGILTEGQAGQASVTATLDAYGAYRLIFFVEPAERAYVDAMLEAEYNNIYENLRDQGYTASELDSTADEEMEAALELLLSQNITVTKVTK